MTRLEFLAQLRRALSSLAPKEVDEIIADYNGHFNEAIAAGRSEEEVAHALGDPTRLARELRAETQLRRWENQRTPGTLVGAILGISGLLALDVLILIPLIFALALTVFAFVVSLFAIGVTGIALIAAQFQDWYQFHSHVSAASHMFAGIGLLGFSIGFGALLWLVMEVSVRLLGRYARLHYRVLKPLNSST